MWISDSLKSVNWKLLEHICLLYDTQSMNAHHCLHQKCLLLICCKTTHLSSSILCAYHTTVSVQRKERESLEACMRVQKMLISSVLLWIKWDGGLHCVLFSAVSQISFQIGSLFNTSLAWPLPSYAVPLYSISVHSSIWGKLVTVYFDTGKNVYFSD